MGNCNFNSEKEKDNIAGTPSLPNPSHHQEPLPVPLLHWQGRLRKGLEGREKKNSEAIRHEGNGQEQSHCKEVGQFCPQRAENSEPAVPRVGEECMNIRFIVNMEYAFQDRENLYLVMDLLTGGDLRYHISRRRKFTEPQTSKSQYNGKGSSSPASCSP